MTLQRTEERVGIRELHDRLSEYLQRVEGGTDVIVTRRGKQIARLSSSDAQDPFEDLSRRGIVTLPEEARSAHQPRIRARDSVSDLVSE
ncbi:type II toxin-antitoxin system prevent-host-death family antitoxin, partial [Spirulina sp. 06S082]|uniref:type II toxin-antitoxin system Phd/YefM family antitoxin n=1 Tax=Spirulina sp. 06S082 TaxID=3110248 RepID=UPI002B205F8A